MIEEIATYQQGYLSKMAREIERKFLVTGTVWKDLAHKQTQFSQAYLNNIQHEGSKSSIRIRVEGDKANINIKSLEIGLSRDEYEYEIALADAQKMIQTLAVGPVIEKIRYLINYADYLWEIDLFLGDNEGLIVAEVEMESETASPKLPSWIGKEVTEHSRYYNVSLSQTPFNKWTKNEQQF